MANSFFKFKEFTVHQDRCAMKVGTDGVLLGACARGGTRILDIGTGTGLVAMMMAQRYPDALITGIDIDHDATVQASQNIEASPYKGRIVIKHTDLSNFTSEMLYDSIVCNPPFFENSLTSPDDQRTAARHSASLPFPTLFNRIAAFLSNDGVCTIIIPTNILGRIEEECSYNNLFINKKLFIKTVERKAAKRVILNISKHIASTDTTTQCLMTEGHRSTWYEDICKDFYL